MFFGFNTFDPHHSPAVSAYQVSPPSWDLPPPLPRPASSATLCSFRAVLMSCCLLQDSYTSGFTGLSQKKSKYGGKNLATAMHIFDESFGHSKK